MVFTEMIDIVLLLDNVVCCKKGSLLICLDDIRFMSC